MALASQRFIGAVIGLSVGILVILYIPLSQLFNGRPPQWYTLFAAFPLAIFVVLSSRPVKCVLLYPDGNIVLKRPVGSRTVHVSELTEIRPWLGHSREDFVIEHLHGSDLIFHDPTLVAVLAADLRELNPVLRVRGVGRPPGAYRDASA